MVRLPMKLRKFCESQDLIRLAFVDSRGYPRVVPAYFIPMAGSFVLGTWGYSAKWQFIQKNPKVGWVIDGGANSYDYRGVSFWGSAEKVEDPRLCRRAFLALSMKYFGSAEHPRSLQLFAGPGCIFIRLRPERFYSWDNASSNNQLISQRIRDVTPDSLRKATK